MARLLLSQDAPVNFAIDDLSTAMTSAVLRERQEDGNTHNNMQMLKLLMEFSAEPGLCTGDDELRIRKLLAMSCEDVEQADALKEAVPRTNDYLNEGKDILVSKRKQLEQLIASGADPDFCCAEDAAAIRECLRWSEKEVLARNAKQEICKKGKSHFSRFLANSLVSQPTIVGSHRFNRHPLLLS